MELNGGAKSINGPQDLCRSPRVDTVRARMDEMSTRRKEITQVFSATLAVLCLAPPPTVAADPERIQQAVERAFGYFETQELRGDQAFFVSQAAVLLGGEWPARARNLTPAPEIEHPVELALMQIQFLPVAGPEVGGEPFAGQEALEFNPAMTESQVESIFRFMHVALSCRIQTPGELVAFGSWVAQPGSGYVVAHQLAALEIAVNNGCGEGDPASIRERLASRMYRELLSQSAFNDLVAEQVAVLCMSGYGSHVPERYFKMLLEEQSPSGDWGLRQLDVGAGVFFPPGHTAALALYGLACYQQQLDAPPES